MTTGGSGGEQRIDAPAALPVGAWTHVAVTRGGNLGILYVNGAEVARNTGLTLSPSSLGNTTQTGSGARSTPTRTSTAPSTASGSTAAPCRRRRSPASAPRGTEAPRPPPCRAGAVVAQEVTSKTIRS
ncbi:LamG-like jellyroll fold domain-containing protein [Dactylosporangium sp. CA-052675]|uniref:LamG-like jellyroll fold domain-containing protein n=1 Tax=Dactylosporangium sp. CA-052675 TaxID=3239927 RepID=UPI003D924C16